MKNQVNNTKSFRVHAEQLKAIFLELKITLQTFGYQQ